MHSSLEYNLQDNDGNLINYPTSASNFVFFYWMVLFIGITHVGGNVGDESVKCTSS